MSDRGNENTSLEQQLAAEQAEVSALEQNVKALETSISLGQKVSNPTIFLEQAFTEEK